MKSTGILAVAVLSLMVGAGYLAAQSGDQGGQQQWLSKQEVETRLNEMGYEVRELKAEKGCVEAEVIDPDGVRSEIYVDPLTAEPGCGGKTEER